MATLIPGLEPKRARPRSSVPKPPEAICIIKLERIYFLENEGKVFFKNKGFVLEILALSSNL